MKIVVEINDATLHHAIEQQLSAVVALQVGKQIETVVDSVLNKKLERFTDEVMAHRVEEAAKKMLLANLGKSTWNHPNSLNNFLERAAITLLREKMKS